LTVPGDEGHGVKLSLAGAMGNENKIISIWTILLILLLWQSNYL
jgi:hypothetical protein